MNYLEAKKNMSKNMEATYVTLLCDIAYNLILSSG